MNSYFLDLGLWTEGRDDDAGAFHTVNDDGCPFFNRLAIGFGTPHLTTDLDATGFFVDI
ncbi:hypothetical protein QEV63_03420 [Trueperella pyogenes]